MRPCFFRFFADRMVKKFGLGEAEGEDAEPIRASEEPHPSELIPYLLNPPQDSGDHGTQSRLLHGTHRGRCVS
jgi:hypothetical protein